MCDPVTAGIILTAASGGAQFINNQQALKSQDREAARGIQRQAELQRQSNQRVNKQVTDIGANTGEAERAQSLQDFQSALRSGRESTEGALSPLAGASDRFVQRTGANKADVKTAGVDQAERLSIIDGILRQRMNEGQDINRTVGDLNELKTRSSADEFLTKLRVAGKRPNAVVDLLAGIGKGVGSGIALRPPVPGAGFNPATIVDSPVTGGPAPFNPFSGGGILNA